MSSLGSVGSIHTETKVRAPGPARAASGTHPNASAAKPSALDKGGEPYPWARSPNV